MAELFLDIRDRHIRAIGAENDVILFQKSYLLKPAKDGDYGESGRQEAENYELHEGELEDILSQIRLDAGIRLDYAHLILPSADIQCTTHVLQRMPQQDALKLLTRKTATEPGDESPHINLCPMAFEQNNQTWMVEYVATSKIKKYKKIFSSAQFKLKTVTSALDATLHAAASIRESIFNAHAIFEINTYSIDAYYISSSNLLFHETVEINESSDANNGDIERKQKRRMFTILDQLYHINSQYISSNPINPLQKVWLCGADSAVSEMVTIVQDAMDVETSLLIDGQTEDRAAACQFTVLNGFQKAYFDGVLFNYMHPDLLRRFPLRKKSGLLIYIATILLAVSVVITTEYQHKKLKSRADIEKKILAAQKMTQAASAAFVKNLDLLRRLSGNQVLFYPIFKELAMKLPDGVFLESFTYSNRNNQNSVDISASFLQSSDLGTKKTLTKMMEIMDKSPYLSRHQEPSVISTSKGLKKIMTVKFTCEVNPLDTAK